jgi:predicted pyridoxine 5'-phosphate oxidase superfamily flavin-nucleotide-binding protein
MAGQYLETHLTPEVLSAQKQYYGRAQSVPPQPERDLVTDDEVEFIASRDSFYLATVTSNGWPYIQHRGGSPGFLRVVGSNQLAFADFGGNRQLLSTGNLTENDRVAVFLMDYPQRTRLKIMGHARVLDAREHPALAAQLVDSAVQMRVERVFLIEVTSFDWNCPKFITPRYTEAEVREVIAPLQRRIVELEARLEGSEK